MICVLIIGLLVRLTMSVRVIVCPRSGISPRLDCYLGGAMLSYSILVIGTKLDFIRNYQLGPVKVLNMGTTNVGY